MKVSGPLGGHKKGDNGAALKSGNGTSRSSSRGRGEDRSWRGVVKAAVVVRLNNLAHSRLLVLLKSQEVGRVTIWLFPWAVVNRVKSLCES